jgi:hypothetical protein
MRRQYGLGNNPSVQAVLRKLRLRHVVDGVVDWLRFRLDYAGMPRYQPLPWRAASGQSAARVEGVTSRWDAMLPVIRDVQARSALDIGCSIGWFSLKLAALDIPTVGVEGYPPYYRTAIYAAKRAKADNFAVAVMMLDGQTVRLLPRVDCTLLLSVWHHLVQQYGLSDASSILFEVWQRTDKILFFESGEKEMGPEYGLPAMEPDARTWLTEYLEQVCAKGSVRHLGLHHAGSGDGRVKWRNLFAVVRDAS